MGNSLSHAKTLRSQRNSFFDSTTIDFPYPTDDRVPCHSLRLFRLRTFEGIDVAPGGRLPRSPGKEPGGSQRHKKGKCTHAKTRRPQRKSFFYLQQFQGGEWMFSSKKRKVFFNLMIIDLLCFYHTNDMRVFMLCVSAS